MASDLTTTSFEYYRTAADGGDIEAQFDLGKCYYYGRGTDINYQKAFGSYIKAAEGGHIEAQNAVGICYGSGKGTQIDKLKSFEWFTKAAEAGFTKAQFNLGVCYQYGRGTIFDMQMAIKWFTKAAEVGDPEAQFGLAAIYSRTETKIDSFQWLQKAAESGHVYAQYYTALYYESGIGTHIDSENAFKWYIKAALKGHLQSQARVRKFNKPEILAKYVTPDKSTNSGIGYINEFLESTPFVYWIPYENLENIEFVACGGFSTIYKATLLPFKLLKKSTVALKCFTNSKTPSEELLKEFKCCLNIANVNVIQVYGISQCPKDKYLIIVMEWCDVGDLGNNLHLVCTYYDVYNIIRSIANGLSDIHSNGLCHKDIHTGNIFLHGGDLYVKHYNYACIGDLGLCNPVNVSDGEVIGVLPYIAPEVLHGKKYTPAADIYSLGIIIWVLLSRQQPFADLDWHNKSELYWNKIEGQGQPEIPDWTPYWLSELMLNCWHPSLERQPSADEIYDLIEDVIDVHSEDLPFKITNTTRISSQIYTCSTPNNSNAVGF